MAKQQTDYAALNKELEQILLELEEPGIAIDTAIDHFRRGNEIIGKLEAHLRQAENKVVKIQAEAGETPE